MHTPSTEELRALVAVAEASSFTAAAKRLGLTTNAISLRIQRLETVIGVRLFVRTTRSVALTDEGERFVAQVAPLLTALELAQEDVRGGGSGLRGTVRIAIPGSAATGPFLRRLHGLFASHPALVIQARITNGYSDLAAEGLDIALVVGQAPASTFVGRRLGTVNWVLAAAPSYIDRRGRPTVPADLANHSCLRLYAHPAQTEWTLTDRRGREVSVPVGGSFEADDSRVLGDATYEGLGIGIRPQGECARAEKAGTLERVLPGHKFQPMDVYALLPKGRADIPRIAACLAILREVVKELA